MFKYSCCLTTVELQVQNVLVKTKQFDRELHRPKTQNCGSEKQVIAFLLQLHTCSLNKIL